MSKLITRRSLLGMVGLSAAAVALAACGQATPTAAPPKPAAAAPTTAPAAAGAAAKPAEPTKPATAPQAAAPAQAGAKIPLTIAVWEFPDRRWQETAANEFQKAHPEVDLKIDKMVYNEYDKKQLALLATGSLQDVGFSGVKWFPTSVFKGAFLALDDLVKTKDPGMADFQPAAIGGSKFEGKLYALPFETNPGNQNVVMYNKQLLDEKGIKYPTDEWTFEQFTEMSAKLTDKGKKIWGTNTFYPGNYYDQACVSRSLGGDIMSEDGKKFTLTTDPKSVEGARWQYDLINKHEAAPKRADREGLNFPSGRIALNATGIQSIKGLQKTIGDTFKWDVVLGPVGPGGLRGSDGFVTMYSISSKTKYPEKAYELLLYETSKEVATRAFVEEGQPPARSSIWASEEAQKINPIWGRAIKWMNDPKTKGPFPHPHNVRFTELQDKWANVGYGLFYGEVGFDEGMKKLQEECQKIMDLPRP